MAFSIPSIEPATVIAGDTLQWTRTLPDYRAGDGWSLAYTLINATGKITITATAQGDDFLVNVPAGTSASYAPGDYAWRAQVARAGEVFTVASGRMTVAPSFNAASLDDRSAARRMLDAVEAVLENRAGSDVAEYEINGRQLKYLSIPDLLKLRDRLRFDVQREVAAQAAAQGLPPPNRLFVRFGR